jgi:prohibitin 1
MSQRVLAGLSGRIAGGALFLGGAGWIAQQSIYNVEPGHRAVVFDRFRGVMNEVHREGTHFVVPLIQWPIIFDARTRPRSVPTVAQTKDVQQVQITLRVLSRPEDEFLPRLYDQYGEDYDERVLPSILTEVMKATVAQHDAEQLLSQREQISRDIREDLTERARNFHIIIDDVAITHLLYSPDFAKAIEDKQVAQQLAERAKFVVFKAEQEKKAAVIEAEGESEAATLFSQAVSKSGSAMLEVRRIEAAREIAATLAASGNVTYLPQGNNVLLNMQR